MFEGLSAEDIEHIELLTEGMSDSEKEQAQLEIYKALMPAIAQSKKRQEKLLNKSQRIKSTIEGEDTESKAILSLEDRVVEICDFIREELGIDDSVTDQEILDAFGEDYPELADDLTNYLNEGNEAIFTLLSNEEGANEAQEQSPLPTEIMSQAM